MAPRTQAGSAAALALARQVVAKNFPRAGTSECERLAWLLVGTETGRAELRLRAQSLSGGKTLPDKGSRDSLSEISGEEMLVLQTMMDKKAQLEQMLSNIMKNCGDTGASASGNIKS